MIQVNRYSRLAPDIFLIAQTRGGRQQSILRHKIPSSMSEYRDVDGMRPGTTQYSGVLFNGPVGPPFPNEGVLTWYHRGSPGDFTNLSEYTDGTLTGAVSNPGDSGGHRLNFSYGAGGPTFTDTSSTLWDGLPHWVSIRFRNIASTVDWHLFIDGVLIDTQATYSAVSWAPITQMSIGQRNSGFNVSAGLTTNHWMMHGRLLTDAEIANLHGNPWQVYAEQTIIGAHQLPTHVDYGKVKVPWTSQPPLGTEIDWGNPITNGLRLADTYQTTHPLDITGLHTGESGQVSHDEFGSVSDPRGGQIRGLFFDSANTTATRRYSQDDLQAIDALTCLAFYRMRTPTGTEKHYLGGVARSGFDAWRLEATGNSGAAYRHFFALYDDTPTLYSTDQAAQYDSTDVTPRIVIGRFERANIFDLWIDGEFYADRTGGAPDVTIRSRPDERFQVQGEHLNSGPRDDEFYLSLVWDRALTENEVKSISKNPWQIFKPREIMVPINEDLPELGTFEKPFDPRAL